MHSPQKPSTDKKSTSFFKRSYQWFYHFYLRYLFKRDTILSTFSVFIVIGMFSILPLNTGILNPFKTALQDLEFNDISYAVLNKNASTPIDNRIIIVNIGNADRLGISLMIEKLSMAKPKVIGMDVSFDGAKDPQNDSILRAVISNTPNFILASKIDWSNKSNPEYIGHFGNSAKERGFVNLIGEDGGTIRNFKL